MPYNTSSHKLCANLLAHMICILPKSKYYFILLYFLENYYFNPKFIVQAISQASVKLNKGLKIC
jgi:hypothetical protein